MTQRVKTILINNLKIGIDGFNVRPLDEDAVARYQEVVDRLPAVEGWHDPDTNEIFLVDGRHRCEARKREGHQDVELVFFEGSRVDAEVRAFSANLPHPLPLTKLQRRKAIMEIVRRRYTRTNNWIAEEAGCSQGTVGKIREELEEQKQIPVLDRLERKGGGSTPREFNRIDSAGRTDSMFGNAPDFFDEAEEAEKARQEKEKEARPPANLGRAEKSTKDGGYNVDEDDDDEDFEAAGSLITGLESASGDALTALNAYTDGRDRHRRTLKFAQINQGGLPIEVVIYVDNKPFSVPVTLLLVDGPIYGVPEGSLAEYQQSALILSVETARQMKLA